MHNSVLLIGQIKNISEIKKSPFGDHDMLECTLRTWKVVGEKQYEAYFKAVAYGNKVSEMAETVFDGDFVTVRGELQNRKHTNREGKNFYETLVSIHRIEKLKLPGGLTLENPEEQGELNYGE